MSYASTNLFQETEDMLKELNLSSEDVAFVVCGIQAGSWKEFEVRAKQINYDSGYGDQEIASDLMIVFGDNSWLERYEYDGSENWVYKKLPIYPENKQPLTDLLCNRGY